MNTTNILIELFFIPLGFVVLGILAKRLGRRDGDKSPYENDFAIGTTVLLMTIGKVVADAAQNVSDRGEIIGWMIGILLVTFLSIDHDRYRSWQTGSKGTPNNRKRLWIGVILPTVLSLVVFFCYQLRRLILGLIS